MFSLIIVVTGLILGLVLRHQNVTGAEILTRARIESFIKSYLNWRREFIWSATAAVTIYVLSKAYIKYLEISR